MSKIYLSVHEFKSDRSVGIIYAFVLLVGVAAVGRKRAIGIRACSP